MAKETVLLVAESNEEHFQSLQESLVRWGVGCPLMHFPDGDKLIAYLHETIERETETEESYIVLLDVQIMGSETYKVIGRIKQHPDLKHIPVAILALSFDLMTVGRCFDMGCSAYLSKPVEQGEFMTVFNRLCEQGLLKNPKDAEG